MEGGFPCYGLFSSLDVTFNIIATTFYGLSSIIAAAGNTFCLIVLWQPSQRSKSNKILTSLALSDCLVGYVCLPLVIWLMNTSDITSVRCRVEKVYSVLTLWMGGSSLCSVVFLAYERYLHIARANRHYHNLTNRKVNLIMILYWSMAFMVSLASTYDASVYMFFGICNTVTSVIFMIVSYFYIWDAVRQSRRRIAANIGGQQQVGYYIRCTKNVLIIILCYLIACLPTLIFIILLLIGGANPSLFSENLKVITPVVVTYIALSNSCTNPFLYVWKDPNFKAGCKTILRRRTRIDLPPRGSISNARQHTSTF
ncbi:adenosine receptor A3-like [Clytia hemisphaerica]|uniref:adenosine receptor A3-like n=1 Tax=Clytia hemisphaerica TaxID=252671 RepID=UPI0034D71631